MQKGEFFFNMPKALKEDHQSSWKDYVNKSVYAYNCSIKATADYSFFFLFFERKLILPIDLLLPDTVNEEQSRITFVKSFRR